MSLTTDDFDYQLPAELIAQQAAPRGESRLLVLDRRRERLEHRAIGELPHLLAAGDLLVLNDTRVLAARLMARRPSGRRFELLLLEPDSRPDAWHVLLRPSARARVGERLELPDGGAVELLERGAEGRWVVAFDRAVAPERLDRIGSVPLPPYIRRQPEAADRERYQTVYATTPGAVAAPTAGLHFTPELLDQIAAHGVEVVRLTLHVGLGTFRPVSVERIADHVMHAERYQVPDATAAAVAAARAAGRRVVAVGTTSVRTLEGAAAASGGAVPAGAGRTDLFITPGFEFQVTGAMLTNFHLPRSTLLMLVSAFAGRERILAAYREAVRERYRFFSYGDAMLIV